MDAALQDIVDNLRVHAETFSQVMNRYFAKLAEKDHFESVLTQSMPGKSQAEKLMMAKATRQWLIFHQELKALEGLYKDEEYKRNLLEKTYFAEMATYKIEESLIRKQRGR